MGRVCCALVLQFFIALAVVPSVSAVIVPAVEKTVVFLFDDRVDHKELCPWAITGKCAAGEKCTARSYCPTGTGFLTGFPRKDQTGKLTTFLVTARHVVVSGVKKGHKLFARMTTGESSVEMHLFDSTKWRFGDDTEWDLAVYNGDLPLEGTEGIPVGIYATDRVLKEKGVTIGDPLFTAGLVPPLAGSSKNYPVARQGTLALFDSSKEGPGRGLYYFAEAQTYEGNSGAPVFLLLGGMRGNTISAGYKVLLIGIARGYVTQPTQIGLSNIGLQAFTRIDLLANMLCAPEVLKTAPPEVDTTSCPQLR